MPKTDTEPKYFSINSLADELMVSTRSIYRLLNTGKLPAFKIGGQVRISREDLNAYIASNRRELPNGKDAELPNGKTKELPNGKTGPKRNPAKRLSLK